MTSIIIPTYTNFEGLKRCLDSIHKYTDMKDIELIVVANGSPKEAKPYATIWHDKAIGYTKAVNEGIKASKGEYIIILNDDTELLPQPKNQWLKMLKDPFQDPQMGITGPMGVVDMYIGKWFIIFFCCMVSRKLIDTIGLLDETFNPGFCEDVDYCMKAQNAGFKTIQVPYVSKDYYDNNKMVGGFPIYHAGNETFKHTGKEGTEVFARNINIIKERYLDKSIVNALKLDGYMPEIELKWLVEASKDKKTILEIGSWHGRSTRALCDSSPSSSIVYAVDTWFGSDNEPQNHGSAYLLKGDHAFDEFLRNNWEYIKSGKLRPIRMHSSNACKLFKKMGMKFDMIFIDGDHTYEGCKKDIQGCKGLLESGGTLCGHDYTAWVGVKQAVDEEIKAFNLHHTIWEDKSKYKITDCCIFYNELELLELRLNELDPIVDEFCIIEAGFTHSGKPKPKFFDEKRFSKFMPKIKYKFLDKLPEGKTYDDVWKRERYQRDQLKNMVSPDTDIVISTDVDEIPNIDAVRAYKPEMGQRYLDMKLYYYWLNCHCSTWNQAMIIGYKDWKNMTPVQIRYAQCPPIANGGWHFSFMGGVDKIYDKLQSWAHAEYNRPDIVDKKWITEAINTPKDVLKRANTIMKFVPLDNTFPKYILNNKDKWKGWIK